VLRARLTRDRLTAYEGEGFEMVDGLDQQDLTTGASVEAGKPEEPLPRRSPAQRKIAVISGCVVAGIVLLVLFDLASFHIVTISPDGSTVLLEGQALGAGNLTLHGWLLALDSFWTVDAPFYAVGVWIFGVTPLLLNLVPAAIAVLVVVVASRLAADGRDGVPRVAAIVVVLALLALPGPDLTDYLLQGPWHIATALCCLLAYLGASRHRFGWPWALAVAMLAAGLLGDLMILVIGVVPVMCAGLVYMRRARSWRAGLPAFSAGVAGLLVAIAVRELVQLVGTLSLTDRNLALRASLISSNFRHVPSRFAALLGVGSMKLKGITNGPLALQFFHAVGLAIVVAVVVAAAFGLIRDLGGAAAPVGMRDERRVDDLLVLGFVADIGFFAFASQSGNLEFVKYLTPGVVFAAVLVGREAGRLVPLLQARGVWRVSVVAMLSICVAFAVDFSLQFGRPAPPRPAYALAQYLRAHGLRHGVGDYWSSSLVTVEADEHVTVRPVTTLSGKIIQFDRQLDTGWYTGQSFGFLVYDTARPWHDVNATSAIATFGQPTQVVSVGTYRVMTWQSGIRISGSMPAPQSPLSVSMSPPRRP
jgi:hypothetical protein